MNWIIKVFWQMVARFRPEQATASTAPHIIETIDPATLPDILPPLLLALREGETQTYSDPDYKGPFPTASRVPDEWRKLERARRRYDKFLQRPKSDKEKTPRPAPQPKPQPAPEPEEKPAALIVAPDEDLIAEETATGERVRIAETELYGEFNFRDTILDQLDRFFVYLKRMKKIDPESYGFYKKIGVTLLPMAATGMTDLQFRGKQNEREKMGPMPKLADSAPWFNQNRPAFGCFAYGVNKYVEDQELKPTDDDHYYWYPKFMYFTKYIDPPPEIQPTTGGDIYKLTIWWDKPRDENVGRHGAIPQEYAVFISKDGSDIHILKMLTTSMVEIQRKHKLEYFHIPKREWKIPKTYANWARREGEPVEQFLVRLFINTVQHYEYSKFSMFRVIVRKRKMTAVFGLNLRRVSYFFQDRDLIVDEGGVTKRIFHAVRAHIRSDGTAVKLHFRGVRKFTWAGCDVEIKVPTLAIDEFNIGAHDEYWIEKKKIEKWLTQEESADMLLKYEPQLDKAMKSKTV